MVKKIGGRKKKGRIKKKENKKGKEEKERKKKEKKEEKRKRIQEIERAFAKIRFHPVATKKEDVEKAKEFLIKEYKKGDEITKEIIIYIMHEHLSAYWEFKAVHNTEMMKRKFPKMEAKDLRMNVFRAIFNYNNSLEGVLFLIDVLKEFNDIRATKLLSYHLTKGLSHEIESIRIIRNRIIEALGEMDEPYALEVLAEYAKYTDNEDVANRLVNAIIDWKERLKSSKTKEKKKLIKLIDRILIKEEKETHYA